MKFAKSFDHKFNVIRVSQDEVHMVCVDCDFKHVFRLTIEGHYQDCGMIVRDGTKPHPVEFVLAHPPP